MTLRLPSFLCLAVAGLCFSGSGRAEEAAASIPTNAPPAREPDPVAAMVARTDLPAVFNAMVDFDRLYFPLWVSAKENKPAAARAASDRLWQFWPEFLQRCTNAAPDDARLAESLAELATRLKDIQQSLKTSDPTNLLAQVQPLRVQLMQQRARLGLDYWPDYLTRYYETMHLAVELAASRNPTNITRPDLLKLRDYCVVSRLFWQQISAAKFDPVHYRLFGPQATALHDRLTAGDKAMDDLSAAFENSQPPEMLASVVALMPPYVEVLRACGDFPPDPPSPP